jgi:voltage-gated potassium channel
LRDLGTTLIVLGWAHPHSLRLRLLIPFALILLGTVTYHLMEGLTLLDSLYLTVMTLSTVGYGDVVPRTPAGKLFTVVLVVGGVFTLFYVATDLIRSIISGELQSHLGRHFMERNLAQLRDHLIVCGYGRMGRLVCREFATAGLPVVVVDANPNTLEDFNVPGSIPLVGDATSDEVLRRAGIGRARAFVTVMASDADNLYATMSARLLNEKLFIVARVEDVAAGTKMMRAGANRVVSPYQIGGFRVAQAVLRPTVVDFIELATQAQHIDLQLEETRVSERSPLAGATLKDSRIRSEHKIIVVAIKKRSGQMIFNPSPDQPIEVDDILVGLGDREHLDLLDRLAQEGS